MIKKINKKPEFTTKDYVMITLFLMLIVSSIIFILNDMSSNPEVADYANISEIEKYYDKDYIESMNKSTHGRLSELQDAGFFQTIFLTTFEIVTTLPRIIKMVVGSIFTLLGLLIMGGSEILPSEVVVVLSTMIFVGILWSAIYFIRKLGK